jgi:hypothetical protein
MNSHGHGMHLGVLIKFFHFALQSYFISKTVRSFGCTFVSKNQGPDEDCYANEERE